MWPITACLVYRRAPFTPHNLVVKGLGGHAGLKDLSYWNDEATNAMGGLDLRLTGTHKGLTAQASII